MIRPPSDKLARKALLLIAAACAALGVPFSRPPLALDIALERGNSGHALVQLGAASFRLAFDFGRQCPKADSCAGQKL